MGGWIMDGLHYTKARTYEVYDEHVTYHGYMDGKGMRGTAHCIALLGVYWV